MALYHHGEQNYEVAASAAAKQAREKLEALINQGQNNAMSVIDKIIKEVPEDKVVKGPALRFGYRPTNGHDGGALTVCVGNRFNEGSAVDLSIHRNALTQLAERGPVSLPAKLVGELQDQGEWGNTLLARNLEEIYAHSEEKYLTRSYNGQLRGFLSNKFRRLDSRPIINAACDAFEKIGARPVEGYATDTKIALKAVLPMVFEPVKNEVLALGVIWQNSDYGNGAHSLRAFMLRLWCTNFAITEECLREVHLGGRLGEDDVFSDRTYELDTKRSASAIKDVIEATLAPPKVKLILDNIRAADAEKIDPKNMSAYLKKQLGAGDAKAVIEAFNSPDVENLPPGNSKWRLSNAISWIAGKQTDGEKKLELMMAAGDVLKRAA